MDREDKSLVFWQKKTYQMLFIVLWAALIMLFLKIGSYFEEILISFAIAVLINYLLSKPVDYINKVVKVRFIAILIMFIAMLAVITFVSIYIFPLIGSQLLLLKKSLPGIIFEAESMFVSLREFLLRYQIEIPALHLSKTQIVNNLGTAITKVNVADFGNIITSIFLNSINAIVYVSITFIFSIYLLHDGNKVWDIVVTPFNQKMQNHFNEIKKKADDSLYAYIFGQFQVAALTASVMLVTYLVLGTPYALLLGFTQLLEIIPVLGTWTAIIPSIIVVFLTSGPSKGLIAMIVYLVYSQLIRDQIVAPRIFGTMLGFHPLVIILTMVVGAKLLGPVGIIIAIPFVAVISSIFDYFLELSRLRVQ